ncbi:MAG: hypothetical protein ABGX16_23675 [Pirellulales bacterium]
MKIKAPNENGQRLSVPSLDSMDELIALNGRLRKAHDCDIQGQSLLQLAAEARSQLLAAAEHFTRAYCEVVTPLPTTSSTKLTPSTGASCPLIMTGHQPEIVHPGVWLKNFTAAHLAKSCHGIAIHLIIDSDLGRAPMIRVPTGSSSSPRTVAIPYDRPTDCIPLEQRPWMDHSAWDTFGARVHDAISPLIPNTMAQTWWSQIATPAAAATTLGLGLARARHLTEISWQSSFPDKIHRVSQSLESSQSSSTLELPQSSVCQLPAFRQFTIHLLSHLPRFHDAYNRALTKYRRIHKIHNHAQPVPDLSAENGWLESPYWIWSTQDPTRRALHVRYESNGLRLTDRHHLDQLLPVTEDGPTDDAMTCLAMWEANGIKIRTRALITTLFARLLLADLFIHGIGGAKYDLVTDEIADQFYGFAPPEFLTLSGTLRLPFNQSSTDPNISGLFDTQKNSPFFQSTGPGSTGPDSDGQLQKIAQTIREFTYHPELHINLTSINPSERHTVQKLLQQKQQWIQTTKTPQNAAQRHRAIVAANTDLQPWLTNQRKQLDKQRISTQLQTAANHILRSREYAFCLFPADRLQNFLLDFSSSMT